jgi:hypothetical protein
MFLRKEKVCSNVFNMGANEQNIPKVSNFVLVMGQSEWPIAPKLFLKCTTTN